MQLRPEIQLRSVMKSLEDVVLPAIDPGNKLALEQGQLIIGMLRVMSQRLPLEYRFDCDELGRLLELSRRLREAIHGGDETAAAIEVMSASTVRGADVLGRARAEPDEVYAAVKDLRSRIAGVVQSVSKDGDPASRTAVTRSVQAAAAEQLQRDRAWVIAQGWEPDPRAIPPIESLVPPTGPSPGESRSARTTTIDKDRPSPEWVASLRRRFGVEREIDRVLSRKMERRAGAGYVPIPLGALSGAVEGLLRTHLKEPFRIMDARWLSGGSSKIQTAFTLDWHPPGGRRERTPLVLRMEPAESMVETSRLREFQVIKAFEGVVPVPPVYWVDPEGTHLPYPGLIYGFAPGVTKPTTARSGVAGLGTQLPFEVRQRLAPQVVEHLGKIHTRDIASAGLTAFDVPRPGTQAAEWGVNWWERVWEEDCEEDSPMMRVAAAWLREHMPSCERLSILHADFRVGNFLFTEHDTRITAWLDWELARIGDRHQDLAWTTSRAFGGYAEDGKTFLVGGLLPEEEFFDAYTRSCGLTVDPKALHYYKVYNAYMMSVLSLATGYRIARNGKTHQDVLVAWLVGIGYMLQDEMRMLIERA